MLLNQYIDGTFQDVPVYYFRTEFDVNDPDAVTAISGTLKYDEAASVYINGVKIAGFDDDSFDTDGYGTAMLNLSETVTGVHDVYFVMHTEEAAQAVKDAKAKLAEK